MIQQMLAIWSLIPLPFLNPAWTSGSSLFMYCWSLAWRILNITLLACEMSGIVQQFEHSLALPFFGIGTKTGLFQSCGHCWVFQICWHIECSTFTASSFRIWNSSTALPLPPLALFVMMLPKAHLTLHSRISGFRWVITSLIKTKTTFKQSSTDWGESLAFIFRAFVHPPRLKQHQSHHTLYILFLMVSSSFWIPTVFSVLCTLHSIIWLRVYLWNQKDVGTCVFLTK